MSFVECFLFHPVVLVKPGADFVFTIVMRNSCREMLGEDMQAVMTMLLMVVVCLPCRHSFRHLFSIETCLILLTNLCISVILPISQERRN